MSVSVCIASRGRPNELRRTLTTLIAGMTRETTLISVALDDDDDADYRGEWPVQARVIWSEGVREPSLGQKYNRAHEAVAPSDICLIWPDDAVMPHRGWDARIEAAAALLPDACGVVLFGHVPGVLQPGLAMTRKYIEYQGFFCQPYTPYWWHETWPLEISTMAGCFVHTDIEVTLLSEIKGQSRNVQQIEFWASFFDAMRPARRAVAEKIIRASSRPSNEKAQLLTSLDEWERKWAQSNSVLRDPENAARLEKYYAFDNEPTERYLRLKAQAEKMMEDLGGR